MAKQKLNLKASCASCKCGEIVAPADVLVSGSVERSGTKVPYRAYLCDEHYELLCEQGNADALTVVDINLDRLTAAQTAFRTFSELCTKHHCPTLRDDLLRGAYNQHMESAGLPHRAYH